MKCFYVALIIQLILSSDVFKEVRPTQEEEEVKPFRNEP